MFYKEMLEIMSTNPRTKIVTKYIFRGSHINQLSIFFGYTLRLPLTSHPLYITQYLWDLFVDKVPGFPM